MNKNLLLIILNHMFHSIQPKKKKRGRPATAVPPLYGFFHDLYAALFDDDDYDDDRDPVSGFGLKETGRKLSHPFPFVISEGRPGQGIQIFLTALQLYSLLLWIELEKFRYNRI